MELSARIASWRTWRKLSRKEFAKRLGLSYMAVYYWENGKQQPTHENVEKIASALGVTVPRFWGVVPKLKARA